MAVKKTHRQKTTPDRPVFEKELAFFVAHQEELVAKYQGKVLVIRGNDVVGAFDSSLAAYLDAQRRFPVGTFMLQPCEPGTGAYTVTLA
ncbi:MAG: hypothetical protein ACREMA_01385 [Longimicrobiales bacterium]